MNAPKQFGFKERKDGSMIHHGSDYAVVVYPSKDNRWSIAEVINECVERDLPRVIERERKRTQRGTRG